MNDVPSVRTTMKWEEIKPRGAQLSREERVLVRKALRTLHTLETMAVNVYKCQIGSTLDDLNVALIAAMANEMTHVQDFQVKLYEYGLRPSKWRWAYWLVGRIVGAGSRVLGRTWLLKAAIWVESKAVSDYARLLAAAPWDDETRATIEKDRADEYSHVQRWQDFLSGRD